MAISANSVGRHAGMGHHDQLHQAALARSRQGLHVTVEHGLERLLVLPLRVHGAPSPSRDRARRRAGRTSGARIHRVPSLSNTAMRSCRRDDSPAPPWCVTRATKSDDRPLRCRFIPGGEGSGRRRLRQRGRGSESFRPGPEARAKTVSSGAAVEMAESSSCLHVPRSRSWHDQLLIAGRRSS